MVRSLLLRQYPSILRVAPGENIQIFNVAKCLRQFSKFAYLRKKYTNGKNDHSKQGILWFGALNCALVYSECQGRSSKVYVTFVTFSKDYLSKWGFRSQRHILFTTFSFPMLIRLNFFFPIYGYIHMFVFGL